VIVSDQSGYGPIVESGVGITFKHDDPQSLAAVMQMLKSQSLRVALGAAGRTRVEDQHTWQRSADTYLSEYGRIIDARIAQHSLKTATGR
jgi:glycosyltransferase involved in cell wall biosynthesis